MKKLALITLNFLFISQVFAQNLEELVPLSSNFVLSVDTKKICEKIGKEKIYQSVPFNTFIRELILNKNPEVQLKNVGIQLDRGMEIFYNITPSMHYLGILYGIEDESIFESYINENKRDGQLEKIGNFKLLYLASNDEIIAWNKDHAIYVKVEYLSSDLKPLSSKSDSYWYRQYPELDPKASTNSNSYDFDYYQQGDYSCDEGACDEGDYSEIEMAYEVVEEITEEPVQETPESIEPFTAEELEEMHVKLEKIKAEYEEKRIERNAVLKAAYQNEISTYFSVMDVNILSNSAFTKGKKAESDVYLWLSKDAMSFEYGWNDFYYPRKRFYRDLMSGLNAFVGQELSANLFLKADKITLETALKYNEEVTQLYDEIYSSKFSKKLLKQVRADQILWISSLSLNSERLWHHYPSIYANIIESQLRKEGDFSEEIAVVVDFFEIMMDEKALGDLVTGDMLFVLKSFNETEVKYTTYEYNEDYSERTEIEGTRIEKLPQFVGLFSTNNGEYIERIMNLAVKHELFMRTNGYYESNTKSLDFPMHLGFAVKNGIAMMSTDLYEIKAFSEGKLSGSMPKDLQSKILKNQGYNMINIQEIMKAFPYDGYEGKTLASYEYIRNNLRTVEVFANFTNGAFESSIDITLPENQKNSADFVWNFVHDLVEIDKQ